MTRKIGLFGMMLLTSPWIFAEKIPGRYIVELSTDPVTSQMSAQSGRLARQSLQSANARTARVRVRAEQSQIRERIEAHAAKVLDSVDTVANALFVDASEATAAQLVTLPGVKRVVPMRRFHLVLDRAVVLSRVTEAWDQIGQGNAGAGSKIAIIDTGIDSTHPGFQDSSLAAPDSFPRANQDSDLAYTSGKIIVARSYVNLLQYRDPDHSVRDHVGHGTALAMIAAGVTNAGPLATITGVAPRAYLGVYKVFGTPGWNDYATDAAILKAIDDAVADGMDVINLSLGDDFAPRLEDDLDAQAIERATQAGVIVVVAAGNNGPGMNTISSPGTAPSAISVGASTNDRTFAASATVGDLPAVVAVPGGGPTPSGPVTGVLKDVANLDGNGLACQSFESGSLSGKIALILRGTCTFEVKLNNARSAGAIGALVYMADDSSAPFVLGAGTATLPAEMISYQDGLTIKQSLSPDTESQATLAFTLGPVPAPGNRLADFSAIGPSVDLGIKPDLMAVGQNMYTATQSLDASGDMYSSDRFITVDGTSFSTPMVAGAAALIKSARPGLSVDQYRSLLINAASADVLSASGDSLGIQFTGAGLLNASAALRSTVTAYPASLSFGSGGASPNVSKTLHLTNVSGSTEQYAISIAARNENGAPQVDQSTVEIAAGASTDVAVNWTGDSLSPGPYQGFVSISGMSSGTRIKVPYWYDSTSSEASKITVMSSITQARRNSTQRDALYVRFTDAAGVALSNVDPSVTVLSGNGRYLGYTSYDSDIPGLFGIDLRMGSTAGSNVFRITVGAAALDVTITGY